MSDPKFDDQNEPHDIFARQVADHPIEDAADERLLARALAEVLAGNARTPTDDDRYRYDHYTDQTDDALLALAEEPLSRDDVEDLDVGQRRTIFLIAQALAHGGGGAEPSQQQALSRLQAVLDLSSSDAMLLEDAGRRHALATGGTTPIRPGEADEAVDRRHEHFRERQVRRVHARHAPERANVQVGVFGSTTSSRLDR